MGRPPFHPGDSVHNYTIEQQYSIEGMGAVYTVKDKNLLIKAPFCDLDTKWLNQFKQDVQSLAALQHPGILKPEDFDLEAAIPWFAIKYIKAKNLRELLETISPFPTVKALFYTFALSQAIHYAHTHKNPICDKSLNPKKILIQDEKPIICDFGMAHFGGSTTIAFGFQENIAYLAPEQLDAQEELDFSVDIYALGAIFYEMVTGAPPFKKISDICNEKIQIKPIMQLFDIAGLPFESPELLEKITKICHHSLAKKREERYKSFQEMLQDVETALDLAIYSEVERNKSKDLSKVVSVLTQAIDYGLDQHFETLEALQNRQETSKKVSYNLNHHLSTTLQLFKQYYHNTSSEKLQENLWENLGVNEDLASWKELLENLDELREEILKVGPAELTLHNAKPSEKLVPSVIVEIPESEDNIYEDKAKKDTQKIEVEAIAIDLDEEDDDLPTSVMANVDFPGIPDTPHVQTRAVPQDVKDIEVHTSDFVVIVEKSQNPAKKKTQQNEVMKPKLPEGFSWVDDVTILCEKDESEMIYIPSGAFIMGTNSRHAFDVEKPEHQVYLDGFFIDKHPITWKQYLLFCEATEYNAPPIPKWGIQENHPVVNINWFDAKYYCQWAGKELPSEAQWEKSAKGGIWLDGDESQKIKNPLPRRKYPWGDESPDENGWKANYNEEPKYGRNRGQKSTSPVGNFAENVSPYTVVDLAGNVWEWCSDWYSKSYYHESPYKNPLGPEEVEASSNKGREKPGRVLRGGSWYIDSRLLRVTARRSRDPEGRGASCGMRTVGLFVTQE